MSAPTAPRIAAAEVLTAVFEDGRRAEPALAESAERHGLAGRDRAFAQHLAYGAVRRRGTADFLIGELSGRSVERLDAPVRATLRLGLFELLDDAAPHSAVDQAVRGTRALGAPRAAGLVNAILRRFQRERGELLGALSDRDLEGASVLHSCPRWIAELWWRELGPEPAREMLAAINRPAEVAVRVNALRATPAEAAAALAADGIVARPPDTAEAPSALPGDDGVLICEGAADLRGSAAFADGLVTPQSRGAVAVVEALGVRRGERVADLCAAPGGKTTQLAARSEPGGRVVAVEQDPERATALAETATRLGAGSVEVIVGDAAEVDLPGVYDRVLVDPPCSDLGTLASHPDARWRKRPGDLAGLAANQRRLLERGVQLTRPGGTVGYSVCTLTDAEGPEVVDAVARETGAEILDLGGEHSRCAHPRDPRMLQIRPDRHGTTGFAIASLRRPA